MVFLRTSVVGIERQCLMVVTASEKIYTTGYFEENDVYRTLVPGIVAR